MTNKAIKFQNGVRSTETKQTGVKWYDRDDNGDIIRLSDANQRKAHKEQRNNRINRRNKWQSI